MTRQKIHEPNAEYLTIGERVADDAAAVIGSWSFILIQTGAIIVWVLLNTLALVKHWDPYPWVLLNLLFSVQAAYTGPILLLAGNRQAQKDRAMAAKDDEEIGLLVKLQQEQMEVLGILKDGQREHAEMLRSLRSANG